MVRTPYIMVALGVLVLGVVAASLWRQSSTRSTPESAAPPVTNPGTLTATDSELFLQVERSSSAALVPGAPVFLTVSLIGAGSEGWTQSLRFETADGKPFTYSVDQLGASATFNPPADRRPAGVSEARRAGRAVGSATPRSVTLASAPT